MKREVVIIGGGFSGLSAGVELASRGHRVTVIERRGHLGGRAYSYRDPVTGYTIDNGQHLLMGCYRETMSFLRKIGTSNKVSFQKNLRVDFAHPGGNTFYRFQALPLPNPFHLLSGFAFFRGLSWRDKLAALQFGKRFRRQQNNALLASPQNIDSQSIVEWLNQMGQTSTLCERFWYPLALAALNDRPELSSATLFSAVLKEALFSGRRGAALGLPQVGLSDLYVDAARDYIERKNGQFLVKSPVVKLHFRGREFHEVELEGGRRLSAEVLLVTVPFSVLRRILPEELLYQDPFFSPLLKLHSSPIVAVNLWFDREFIERPLVGLWGTQTHWIFNKSRLLQEEVSRAKQNLSYLSLVISGARSELQMTSPELVQRSLAELRSLFPQMEGASLIRSLVLKEPEATLAPEVGISSFRPSQKTPYHNFFLAGDWTQTGLPATIESAVRSGHQAVQEIERME